MKTKHTPEPWNAIEDIHKFRAGGMKCIVGIDIMSGTEAIGRVYNLGGDRLGEMRANARLIAAAPEMLEALKFLLNIFQTFAPWENESERLAEQKAKDTIAKADAQD